MEIEKNGLTFRYPKSLQLQEVPSTEGNYANYQIQRVNNNSAKSIIMISVPLKNTSTTFSFLDNTQPFGKLEDIKTVVLNKHQGKTITYRQVTTYPGDVPVQATITFEQYSSKYTSSPVLLRYTRDDSDASLDKAWKSIRSSISY